MALDDKSASTSRRLPPGARVAIVVSEYHRELTGAMLASARSELEAAGLGENALEVAWVPGAFELPIVAQRFARRDDVHAVLCLGLVLTGETTHDRGSCFPSDPEGQIVLARCMGYREPEAKMARRRLLKDRQDVQREVENQFEKRLVQ